MRCSLFTLSSNSSFGLDSPPPPTNHHTVNHQSSLSSGFSIHRHLLSPSTFVVLREHNSTERSLRIHTTKNSICPHSATSPPHHHQHLTPSVHSHTHTHGLRTPRIHIIPQSHFPQTCAHRQNHHNQLQQQPIITFEQQSVHTGTVLE